ncbi:MULTISPECIES: ArsR/SmtB family transcription factor [unclassified Sphingomonas]|jgi:DNA-binding transcriptional ArsR family regulator|uniref:ArsR/SmtB family transcription factor n=1 Tax=unclassified Sphingomonas TaxID=196159 RepID=UPI0008324850|nr:MULTISPECIES: metalloregulator ArsR/SmtB family transcription factor [unclassified Sphingomonas]
MEKNKARSVMSALSQETRLAVFLLLIEAGEEGLPAGAIAEATKTLPTAMSAHLTILTLAGLVVSTKVGRSVIYRAVPKVAQDLAEFLNQVCKLSS